MRRKKSVLLGVSIILLLAVVVFANYRGCSMFSNNPLINLSKFIKKEKYNELNLTIYYISPYTLTSYPLSVDGLIGTSTVNKIVIDNIHLEGSIILLNQISRTELVRVENPSQIDARLYYVFKNKESKIFDVVMWGSNNSIIVNEIEVQGEDSFYDVIMPFLPDDAVKELRAYLE